MTSPFTEEEVFEAVKDMGLTKTPTMDGFLVIFYQKYWHIIGTEVSHFCLEILNSSRQIDDINVTSIILIPKVPNSSRMVKFRLLACVMSCIKLLPNQLRID